MLVLILGYVGLWVGLTILLGLGVMASDRKSGEKLTIEDVKGSFIGSGILSFAIVILIVSCRIVF